MPSTLATLRTVTVLHEVTQLPVPDCLVRVTYGATTVDALTGADGKATVSVPAETEFSVFLQVEALDNYRAKVDFPSDWPAEIDFEIDGPVDPDPDEPSPPVGE
jgi:hypothetical protein